ncbi:EGF domain-specific O-linked N-acetylglucosamine transferase-like isoform X2 [Ornithodoros turicata]|uniref:EGF domain-specific O-linked N-acetylglucosamine transferase-like isoform X2 n=1 Tax=Ornithodoros turicata TaxID=34597 RepID=UPI0031399F6F
MLKWRALFVCFALEALGRKVYDVDLPEEHMACFFRNNPNARRQCERDANCPFRHLTNSTCCWGHEPNCSPKHRYYSGSCPGNSKGWTVSKAAQLEKFFEQGDFGYVAERRKKLSILCRPEKSGDSLLECTPNTELCRAKHIRLDFERLLKLPPPVKYREDILGPGLIGGCCRLDVKALKAEGHHKSPLQSWYAELEHFAEFSETDASDCDIVIKKPTVLMKLDATVNIYHHFCDFVNLYLSLHFNNTFHKDFNILIWDTFPYRSNVAPIWKAFTHLEPLTLAPYAGKKVCFHEALFSFLPRMIFGLYYNMPLVPGCSGSGIFRAFNRHVLHRLRIKVERPKHVRITFVSRISKHRLVLNEDELIARAKKLQGVSVHRVSFTHATPFVEQIAVSANTDILIGMHGAGLTHVLFQPDWGVLFELYNCEDEACYRDLARLRGVRYVTWEDTKKLRPQDEGHHPTLGAHAKFTNYEFDAEEFMRLLRLQVEHVRSKISVMHDEL